MNKPQPVEKPEPQVRLPWGARGCHCTSCLIERALLLATRRSALFASFLVILHFGSCALCSFPLQP